MIKAGTVKELPLFKGTIATELYCASQRIVTMMNEMYGAERDADRSGGSFVLIAESVQDLEKSLASGM